MKKEMVNTTSGTTNTYRINKLAKLGWLPSIDVVRTSTLALRRLTNLKSAARRLSVFILLVVAALRVSIADFTIVCHKSRTYRRLRQTI